IGPSSVAIGDSVGAVIAMMGLIGFARQRLGNVFSESAGAMVNLTSLGLSVWLITAGVHHYLGAELPYVSLLAAVASGVGASLVLLANFRSPDIRDAIRGVATKSILRSPTRQ